MPVMNLSQVRKTRCVISRDVIQNPTTGVSNLCMCNNFLSVLYFIGWVLGRPEAQQEGQWQQAVEWLSPLSGAAGDCACPRSVRRPWPPLEIGLESQDMYIQTCYLYVQTHTRMQLASGVTYCGSSAAAAAVLALRVC